MDNVSASYSFKPCVSSEILVSHFIAKTSSDTLCTVLYVYLWFRKKMWKSVNDILHKLGYVTSVAMFGIWCTNGVARHGARAPTGVWCMQYFSILTWLLKECSSVLVPTITNIVNISLISGQFHPTLKESVISPLLKKPTLDKEELSNYRPISNLTLISKIIERVVKSRLMDHLTSNSLLNSH